jgi:hypothetical protein
VDRWRSKLEGQQKKGLLEEGNLRKPGLEEIYRLALKLRPARNDEYHHLVAPVVVHLGLGDLLVLKIRFILASLGESGKCGNCAH